MMKTRSHAAAVLATAMLAFAAASPAQDALPALGVLTAREQLLTAVDRMPEPQLKTFFLRCSRESSQRMLGLDDAIVCSMANDALLKRSFRGNFEALLAWWRLQRDKPEGED